MRKINPAKQGFSLVELLVAMVLMVLVVAGMYKSYVTFTSTSEKQEQIVQLNQNARFVLERMTQELRMAGLADPTKPRINQIGFGNNGANYAQWNRVQFTSDITGGEADGLDNDADGIVDDNNMANSAFDGLDNDGNGLIDEIGESPESFFGDQDIADANEDVSYFLQVDPNDANISDLVRQDNNAAAGTPVQVIMKNIEAINFLYFDIDGNPLAIPATPGNLSTIPPVALAQNIRSVQIAMVIRSDNPDYEYTDTTVFRIPQDLDGDGNNEILLNVPAIPTIAGLPDPQRYKRRLVITRVYSRNMELDI